MSKKSFIDSVEVHTPCDADWEEMIGNDKVRYCGHCSKSVNNISALRRKDAMKLVRASNGDLCIRYIPDPTTKRPMFVEQLVQIARRTPGFVAGVMSASISLSTLVYGQQKPQSENPEPSAVEQPFIVDEKEVERITKTVDKDEKSGGVIRGVIRDYQGKPLPGVMVFLASESYYDGENTLTDENGSYIFDELEPETYHIRVYTRSGNVRKAAPGVTLTENETIIQDLNVRTHIKYIESGTGSGISVGEGFGGAMIALEYKLPLNSAVADQDIKLVKQLLDSGENPNGKDANYNRITPLFLAVENGNIEIVSLLIQYGAKVNARDESKRTPLMFIDSDATPELINVLVRSGAKVNVHDEKGVTPLLVAAGSANADVVSTLIDVGADLNSADDEGITPLIKAVVDEKTDVLNVLITAGADITVKDKNGDTAWDKTSDPEIEKALIEAGAVVNYDVEVEIEAYADDPIGETPKP